MEIPQKLLTLTQMMISSVSMQKGKTMYNTCDDNRFELIDKYKQQLIESTNIEDSPDEMKDIVDYANTVRTTHNTVTNETSSRSHAICNFIVREIDHPEEEYAKYIDSLSDNKNRFAVVLRDCR